MNNLSIEKIKFNYAGEEVHTFDFFIDGISLQQHLRSIHKTLFTHGRFKEIFSPILGRDFSDKLTAEDPRISSKIPLEGEELVIPIYGCHDDCCVYVFAKVVRINEHIYWNELGRNNDYILNEDDKSGISWLPDPTPFSFEINNYKKILKQLN